MRLVGVALVVAAATVAAGCSGGADRSASTASAVTTSTAATASATSTTSAATTTTVTPSATSPSPTSRATSSSPSASPSEQRLAPVPRAGAEPKVRFPDNPPAVGAGANVKVSAIPDSVWQKMVGYSWTSGCPVGRSSLRYVTVNFWGFDGKRSRGAVVVHEAVAWRAARAFSSLYDQRFRIRQMRPMDSTWGHNPKGPGADDYAAMEADNTSAFNCRYVGGQEERKVWSNHAYGKAIDVNDFENPYVDASGEVYPDPYFVRRRDPAPGVFSSSGSAPVRAFTSQGFRWGGLWSHPDYQHFDAS